MATTPKVNIDIEPGGVNKERTHCCCSCCHEIMVLDETFTKDTVCPHCEEDIFSWVCWNCLQTIIPGDSPEEPAFADMKCQGCDQLKSDIDREDQINDQRKSEQDRIKRAAQYRNQKAKKTDTTSPEWSMAMVGGRCELTELQALRIRFESDWNVRVRPYVLQELEAQGQENLLTPTWCAHQLSFFLKCWKEYNEEGLLCGATPNLTLIKHSILAMPDMIAEVRLRQLREEYMESEGVMPTAPAVHIRWSKNEEIKVTWDSPGVGDDVREIYRHDEGVRLNLFEFLIWSARVGGVGGQPLNERWITEEEPEAYVPSVWCGKPLTWEEERQGGFRRWFWMVEGNRDLPLTTEQLLARRRQPRVILESTIEKSRDNMQVCHVCFRKPSTLIECQCGEVLYCSKECQDEHWKVHQFDINARHKHTERYCLNCGKEGMDLPKCGRCKICFFCDRDCQVEAWKLGHKEQCVPL